MDLTYCYEKAAPPGSAFYYSVMHLTKNQRDACVAIAAFYQEVEKSLFDCREPQLAQIKIQWWRGEAAKLSLGKPEHPVSLVLQKLLPEFNLSPQLFVDMVDGIEAFYIQPPQTFTQYLKQIENSAGIREILIAEVSGAHGINHRLIALFTAIVEIVYQIQNLRLFLRAGLMPFAEEQLQQFGVTADNFLSYVPLLAHLQIEVKQLYTGALLELKQVEPKAYLSLLIRCRIALIVLDEIAESEFAVFESFINITPLRRWWVKTKTVWSV